MTEKSLADYTTRLTDSAKGETKKQAEQETLGQIVIETVRIWRDEQAERQLDEKRRIED